MAIFNSYVTNYQRVTFSTSGAMDHVSGHPGLPGRHPRPVKGQHHLATWSHRGDVEKPWTWLVEEPTMIWGKLVFYMEYPLVNIQKAIENGHGNRGFTH